jgi:hypothetical protein
VIGFKGVPEHIPVKIPFYYLYNYGGFALFFDDIFQYADASSLQNIYGTPTKYQLTAINGQTFTVDLDNVKIFNYGYKSIPLREMCIKYANDFAIIESKLFQNIDTSLNKPILETSSLANEKRLKEITRKQSKYDNETYIYSTVGLGDTTKLLDLSTELKALELLHIRTKIRNDFLSKIGIHASNYDKRERIQSIEVGAFASESIDNINSIIDTFNRNSEQQNSSIRMFINTKTIDILEHELEQNNENVPRETGENNV